MNSNEFKSYSTYSTLNSNHLKSKLKLSQIFSLKGLQTVNVMLLEVH
jgi:hypothetical protein